MRKTRAAFAAGLAMLAAGPLASAEATTWTPQVSGTEAGLAEVSCPTLGRCSAVGSNGTILATVAGGAAWQSQPSSTTENLSGVSCATATHCWAVGTLRTILATTDGGSSWRRQPTSAGSYSLNDVSCPTVTHCWIVGSQTVPASALIVATSNGGASWSGQTAPVSSNLNGVSCPTVTHCWAVGSETGTFQATTNGGATWTLQRSIDNKIWAIDCPSTSRCIAVGLFGVAHVTNDGGATWTSRDASDALNLNGVDCPTTTRCWAVGSDGEIVTTSDGGSTWTEEASGTTETLTGVSCPSTTECWAVGNAGTIVKGTMSGDASGQCTSPTAKVLDGYAGSGTYVRMRVQQLAGGEVWACFRATNGGALNAGGRFVFKNGSAATPLPTTDAGSDQCSTAAGNQVPEPHPAVNGAVAGVPFLIDSYSGSGEAWACVQVGTFKQRVVVRSPAVQVPVVTLELDDPAIAPPPPAPGRAGYASSTCQNGVGGTKAQLLNTDVGSGHAWLYTWQPNAERIHVCARVEAGAVNAGGMLTFDAAELPGADVEVIREVSGDTTPCTERLAWLENPVAFELSHAPLANPASVCLVVGTTRVRVTVGASGSVTPAVPPGITWTPDPGTPG